MFWLQLVPLVREVSDKLFQLVGLFADVAAAAAAAAVLLLQDSYENLSPVWPLCLIQPRPVELTAPLLHHLTVALVHKGACVAIVVPQT